MNVLALIVSVAITLFIVIMWVRFIIDLISSLSREWRPTGFVLVVAEVAFTVTDPPIKAVRRVVPPFRVGGVALDFSWGIVLIGAFILRCLVGAFLN